MRLLDLFDPSRPRPGSRWVWRYARQLTRHEAAVLLGYHETHREDPGYEPGTPGLRAADRAVRRRGWGRDAVIREGQAIVAVHERRLAETTRPDTAAELHAAARFYPAEQVAPGVEANPCLVVADQAVFVSVVDGALVVDFEV